MQIIILGGGVIGVTSAYYLAKAGADVTVIERQSDVAAETSFANAGQISPGYSTPWAAPGIPLKAAKWLLQKHAPLKICPDGTSFQRTWMMQMLANCNSERYAINKERMMRVAEYSRDCLRKLRDDTGIHYEERTRGTLQLLRTSAQMNAISKDVRVLDELGVPHQVVTGTQLSDIEPALAHVSGLAGGLHLPNDETGDCHLFTVALAKMAQELGVKFLYNTLIDKFIINNGKITGVQTGNTIHTADIYVSALASYSRQMLLPLGLDLPVYPVKGYSLTIPIIDEQKAPASTILDESYKVAITRLGDRIRVGGMAELSGFDTSLKPQRRATLEMVTNSLFAGAGDMTAASFWTGLRPMTPDSTPIIGTTRYDNLYINTGHGTLGWTMACGSGQLITDIIMGRPTAISIDGLSLARYH